jgi:hypothetical protein
MKLGTVRVATHGGRLAGILFPASIVTRPIELMREMFMILSAEDARKYPKAWAEPGIDSGRFCALTQNERLG